MGKARNPDKSGKKKAKKSSPVITTSSPIQENEHTWDRIRKGLEDKDDYKVRYYLTGNTTQVQRNWVAQTFSFFNGRSKREKVPTEVMVNGALNADVGGYLGNMTDLNAPVVTFKAAKHVFSMIHYLRVERGNHGNVEIHISVDNAPFIPVL